MAKSARSQTAETPQLELVPPAPLASRRVSVTPVSATAAAAPAVKAVPPPAPEPSPAAAPEVVAEAPAAPAPAKPKRRATAESMAQKQREISISEFFTKNRHLLGFDNASKALLTTVKEAVDNSLDACEEAGILPELEVEIIELGGDRFRVCVEDNGPGIVKAQIPKVFGKLLYGSKFHRLKQSRGQQGIGISAAVMYGQLTTGKPARVLSRTGKGKPAHEFLIRIDTRSNTPDATDNEVKWARPGANGENVEKEHGTRVEIDMTANFINGQRSVLRYLEQTALANPHASVRYVRPKQPEVAFPRAVHELPREAVEIMPHPHGIELGMLMQKITDTDEKTISGFLQRSFSRVSSHAANEILGAIKVAPRTSPQNLTEQQIEALHKAMIEAKLPSPPTDCLSPIGDELMRKGLISYLNVLAEEGLDVDQETIAQEAQLALPKKKKGEKEKPPEAAPAPVAPPPETPADAPPEEGEEIIKNQRYFIATVTRQPKVYRGNPFQIEVGIAYGGSRPADRTIDLYRMANRVPLLFQRGACGVTEAVVNTPWRNYEVQQSRGALPVGPMVLLVHIASVWVPFTSESKEAIAHYPEILGEIRLATQECGRRLAAYLRKKKRASYEADRRNKFELYIAELARCLHSITGKKEEQIRSSFTEMSIKLTAAADFEKNLEEAEKKPALKKKSRDEDE
jgi:DNA topoisomerase-6 subunit B